MAKPANANQHAQNVHADLPEGAMEAQLHKFDITDTFGTVASVAEFGSQMYFGNGNSPANYHIDQNDTLGFQLDLKEHYRTGDDIAPTSVDADGTAHFTVPAGLQVATEQSVDYCLLGDSPVTMGKSMRRLQSSHEPSYILAS